MAFNRPEHTKEVLDGLKKERVQEFSVFIDGPDTKDDEKKQKELLDLFKKIDWANVKIHKRKESLRLAKSMSDAVSKTLKEHEAVFVLEDDCVPKIGFSSYIYSMFNRYKHESKIRSICAYSYPIMQENTNDVYFIKRFCPWGWGTWRDRWKDYDTDLRALAESISSAELKKLPDDLASFVTDDRYLTHSQDIWSLNWILTHYLSNTLAVYPGVSLIENIGFDGSGVHSASTSIFKTNKNDEFPRFKTPSRIKFSSKLEKRVNNFLKNHSKKTMKFSKKNEMKNLVIAMSGGTTTVINSTLAGIIKAGQKSKLIDEIYAGYPGIYGVLENKYLRLTNITNEEIKKLKLTPASGSIGISRVDPVDENSAVKIERSLRRMNVGYFINIGGNGTIKQSIKISEYINWLKIAAIPKTVDNDLGDKQFRKVLYTPGFPSCVAYWYHKLHIFNEENLGAFSHDQVLIAQTFGRETGFIAGSVRLADPSRKLPLILLLPEDKRPIEKVIKKIKQTVEEHKRAIVVMSEGYNIGSIGKRFDKSGQTMYGTSETTNSQLLVNKLAKHTIQARTFIPGYDQRSEIIFVSNKDLKLANNLGRGVIGEFEKGNKSFFLTISSKNKTSHTPEITSIKLSQIKNFSRSMPAKWIDKGNFDVTDAYVKYLEAIVDLKSPFVTPALNKITFSDSPLQ